MAVGKLIVRNQALELPHMPYTGYTVEQQGVNSVSSSS